MALESLDGIPDRTFSTITDKEAIFTGQGITEGVLPQTASITHYYAYEAGSGNTITDYSGNNNNATLSKGTVDWISGYDGFGGMGFDKNLSFSIPNAVLGGNFTAMVLTYHDTGFSTNRCDLGLPDPRLRSIDLGSGTGYWYYNDGMRIEYTSGFDRNAWQLATTKWDGTTWQGFDAGTEVGTATGTPDNNGTSGFIGANENDSEEHGGRQSLVILWDAHLTDTEVADIATALEVPA